MSAATSTNPAAHSDAHTAEAYAFCRSIARREAKNFYWAFRVLPRAKSDAMCAVYAFMRRADDIADDESKTLEQRRAQMKGWMGAWRASRRTSGSAGGDNPVFVALGDTMRKFDISESLIEEVVAGTTMDLEPQPTVVDAEPLALAPSAESIVQTFATFDDLYRYCYLVASVVGLVSIHIFGYSDPRAEQLAEETGIAFQLTNILRDVKEDIERGRVYLPLDLLDEFGETVPELHELAAGRAMTERERGMLATLAIRAEKYYVSGRKLIPLLSPDSRAAMWVLLTIYHRLLGRIAARRMEVFAERVSVPAFSKLSILVRGALFAAWNRVLG